MIIELVGPPASGKTSLAKILSERLDFPIVKITGKSELLTLASLFASKHPLFTIKTLSLIVTESRSWPVFRTKVLNTFLHHAAKYEKARKLKNAIIDEGHVQNFYSIFERPVPPRIFERYLEFIPRVEMLILLATPKEVRGKRADERGYGAREGIASGRERASWGVAMEINEKIFLPLFSQLADRTFVVSSQADESTLLQKLSGKL
mgnify:CR=1 FL=1